MLSLATQTDRTLFFDFLPIELGTVRGMKTRIQLYTVPGQVFYDATRKLVLRGADAVVFVADSQAQALDGNKESFQNLIENLKEQGADLEKLPHVIQFNKRDTPNALPVEVLDREINRFGAPTFEACATQGRGVRETLKGVALLVLKRLTEKYGGGAPAVSAPDIFSQAPGATQVVGPRDLIRRTTSGPLEVEDLGAGEMLEEIEEMPVTEPGAAGGRGARQQRGGSAGGARPEPVQRRFPGGDPIEALPQIGHIGQTRRLFPRY